jgi:hypothetical protein
MMNGESLREMPKAPEAETGLEVSVRSLVFGIM